MNHHGRRSGAKLGELLRRWRRTTYQLVEQDARMQIGDHRPCRLEVLAACQHHGLGRAPFERDASHRCIEPHLAAGRRDGARHRGDDGVDAALAERHAENLIGHRFQIGKQRATGDIRREVEMHAPHRERGLELVVLEILIEPLAR